MKQLGCLAISRLVKGQLTLVEKCVAGRHFSLRIEDAQQVEALDQELRHVGDGGRKTRLPRTTWDPGQEISLGLLVAQQLAQLHSNPCRIYDPHINRE